LRLAAPGRLQSKRRVPDWLIVIVLGIVEGITEFIPVSSTGHLLLTENLLPGAQHWLKEDLFNIVIQGAAVVAVIPLFRARLKQLADVSSPQARGYWCKLMAAFGITAVGGLILDKNNFKLPEAALPVTIAMIAGGVLFLVVEFWLRGKRRNDEITWPVALAVGFGQLVAAVFPGSSRSGVTILLSLLFGVSRPAATEFCFLVGIPTLLAAGAWKILKALLHHDAMPSWSLLVLGCAVSAIVSFISVKWLLRYVQTHSFVAFGWYRIAFGLLLLLLLK
jgi:undecaprenyl-diphosphatase